jgi:hypothetical protein
LFFFFYCGKYTFPVKPVKDRQKTNPFIEQKQKEKSKDPKGGSLFFIMRTPGVPGEEVDAATRWLLK